MSSASNDLEDQNADAHYGGDEQDQADESQGDDEGTLIVSGDVKKVVMEPKDITIFQYKRWYDQGRLNLNPDWQRAYVWRGKRPSFLIESLLMQIPIPVIFLAKTEAEGYEVIDGVQRLTTCFHFIENKFALTELTVFHKFNGLKFKQLPAGEQSQIEDAVITSFILSERTAQDMLFTIFERINTGGVSLNAMEIRNCVYRGKLNEKIKALASNKDFVSAINMRNLSERMLDRSLILRFLAFYERGYEKASSGLKSFLNTFSKMHANPTDEVLKEFEDKFKLAMRNSVTVFGNHAFRLRRDDAKGGGAWASRVNASIFQSIATSMTRYDHHEIALRRDAIFEAYLDIQSDSKWVDAVSKATADYQNIKYSFETWRQRLDDIMKESVKRDKKRLFSQSLKTELYNQNSTCAICDQKISSIYDAAVDHVDQYWLGGRTDPSNARLAHRICNMKRSRLEVK